MIARLGVDSVDGRLDRLTAQIDEIAGELRQQRLERDRWRELADDLAPLAEQAVAMATRHLDADSCDFSDVASLAHSVVRDAATLQAWIGPLRILAALADELGPLGTAAMTSLNRRLQQLDERGYFSFTRQALGVVDTVVTSFTEEDVRLLGDNIVLILQTVKQMTQPEVMTLLGRMMQSLQDGDTTHLAETPSALSLLRQLRDPLLRRGLARVLTSLRAIGAQSNHPAI